MKLPNAQHMPAHDRREDRPATHGVIEEPDDEMIEAGAEFLYGKTRAAAIELDQEERFQACCEQAKKIYLAMMMAKSGISQQQLAEGEPVNNPPLLW
jgi:hypothetical protein